MPKTLTPLDCHALINEIYRAQTGMDPEILAVDTSSFVSVGETILSAGVESTLSALSMVIGKTFMAVRPYRSKFGIIEEVNDELFRLRQRKISFYSRYAMASGDWNTQLYTNFADGYSNGTNNDESTHSMYYQNQPKVLEMNFCSFNTWQDSTIVYRDQLKTAFSNEANFADFMAGILTEKGNDIESERESFRRVTLLNRMAGNYAMSEDYPTLAFDFTAGYNEKFGTNYTGTELRTTYLKSFLEYMVATIKILSRRMEYRTTAFHIPYTKTDDNNVEYNILRHTPRDRQRLLLFSPLIVDAEAMVMPEIFNTNYLDINSQFEAVDYWQNFNTPASISVKPAIPGEDGYQHATETNVELPYVIGALFDRDSIATVNYLEDALASYPEARKRYNTIWWTFGRGSINDYSENFILFYMSENGAGPTPGEDIARMSVTPDTITIACKSDEDASTSFVISDVPENTTTLIDGVDDWDENIVVTTTPNEETHSVTVNVTIKKEGYSEGAEVNTDAIAIAYDDNDTIIGIGQYYFAVTDFTTTDDT